MEDGLLKDYTYIILVISLYINNNIKFKQKLQPQSHLQNLLKQSNQMMISVFYSYCLVLAKSINLSYVILKNP